MTKKRIVFVIGSLEIGGTEQHLCAILPQLKNSALDITVVCLQKRGALAAQMDAAGIPVIAPRFFSRFLFCRAFHLLVATIWVAFVFRAQRPDIVHTFLPEAYIIAGSVAIIMRIPIRLMSRRSLNNYQNRRPLVAFIERCLHRHMHVLLGNSSAVIKQLKKEVGKSKTNTHLIYSGLEMERFSNLKTDGNTRSTLGIPKEAIVFVIVANLIPYKGHADLLEAFELIADKLKADWRLLCVGKDSGILSGLKAQAKDRKLGKRVLWLGQRTDIPNVLAAADIGVLASREEGLPTVVMEGMAAGLPMVVTNVGGNSELVIDNKTGIVVPPRNPKKMASALLSLANDAVLREKMGLRGRTQITENFSLERCVAEYRSLYDSLLNQLVAKI